MRHTFKKTITIVLAIAMLLQVLFVPNVFAETTVEQSFDFESDLAGFAPLNQCPVELDLAYNHTQDGEKSMKVSSMPDGKYHIRKTFADIQLEKTVSIWFYDVDPTVQNQVFFIGDGGNSANLLNEVMIGPLTNTNKYGYRVKGGGSDDIGEIADRTNGWHKFTIDYTVQGQVTISIDDDMTTAKTFNGDAATKYGFKYLRIQDAWANNEDNPVNLSSYFDDLLISKLTNVNDYIPTNPVTNDMSNLFGWTSVAGYDDYTNYEYCVDGPLDGDGNPTDGGTYTACTANPQPILDEDYAAGVVRVRLKNTVGGVYPSLSNTVPFTKAAPVEAPTNPVTNDINNLFGWTSVAGYDDYTNYEYCVDGPLDGDGNPTDGGTYTSCTANPQPIPDENYAVGTVRVRIKNTTGGANPALSSTVAFTKAVNAETPINPIVNDIENLFGWTPVAIYQNFTNYEYSIDGPLDVNGIPIDGGSYSACTANPQPIPDGDYAVGTVRVRLKNNVSGTLEGGEYPSLSNHVPFTTVDGEMAYKYETNDTVDDLAGLVKTFGNPELSSEVARSGISSMVINSTNNSAGKPRINITKNFSSSTGKVINLWYYDTMEASGPLQVTCVDSVGTTKLSFKLDYTKNEYYYRAISSAGDETSATTVVRAKGWHKLTWDCSDGISTKLLIDDTEVKSIALDGFVKLVFEDFWSTSTQTHYFDDFTIYVGNKTIEVPEAPTAPVIDDNNNTFGWTALPTNSNATDYEISYDFGQSFEACTANPQPVGNANYAVGQVMVRLKAINGHNAGAVIKNDVEYISTSNVQLVALKTVINFAKGLFKNDYDANDWSDFTAALNAAELIGEGALEVDIVSARESLDNAINSMNPVLPDNVVYEFEKNQAESNPFEAITGTLTKGEDTSAFGTDTFLHYTQKFGAALKPVQVNGKYEGTASYTFAKSLSNKVVSIGATVAGTTANDTEYMLYDENNNYVGFRSKAGVSTNYEFVYRVNNGAEVVVDTEIRRLNSNYELTWDMVNEPGKTVFYYTGVRMGAAEGFTDFNKICITTANGTDEKEYVKFDRVKITEKNPTTNVEIRDENVTLGYYDTYDMEKPLLNLTTEKAYPTTDVFTFTSSDSSIVNVTSEGSCEPMGVGNATVTVTASSGKSDSINIEVADIKTQNVFITDAQYIDIVAMGKPGQDTNNSDPVTKVSSIKLVLGESKVLNTVITPKNATARLVEWTSSDTDVVNVKDGLVTGVNYGTATISIITKDGTNLADSCTVTVAKEINDFGAEIFVSNDGNDTTGDGSISKPLKTAKAARDKIRSLRTNGQLPNKGVIVYFREGVYSFNETLLLDAQDSGTKEAPIKYAVYMDEEVKFIGGVQVDTTAMTKVTSQDPIYSRIPNPNKVYSIDLTPYGIPYRKQKVMGKGNLDQKYPQGGFADFEFVKPYYQLFFNNEPMTLSRYPDTGFIKTTSYPEVGELARFWEPDMIANGLGKPYELGFEQSTFSFTSNDLSATKLATWSNSIASNDGGAWADGFWGVVYRSETVPIQSITGNTIKSGLVSSYVPKTKMNFYVYNLIEELTTEGEWYIDFLNDKTKPVLYFIPPANTDMTSNDNYLTIPTLDDIMIHIKEADYITFDGIDFECTNNTIVTIEGGQHNIIKNANISDTTSGLVRIIDSNNRIAKYNGLSMCNVFNIDGGVSLGAGDRNTLERGYNFVENCTFEKFSMINRAYNPAVSIDGVGNRVTNCVFSDAPHSAINFSGVESTMEFLEIYNVLQETGDQGSIYTGRDTLNRGAIIRNSYFHDFANTTHVDNSAIYFDDARGGGTIIDNIIDNTTWGIKFSSGRDISIIGNQFTNLECGLVTMPGHILSIGPWYTHGYRLICIPADFNDMCSVPWDDPNSAYGRFEHLYYTFQDNPAAGKYIKAIDNKFVNMFRKIDPNETIIDFNIWSKFWKIQDYNVQRATIDDWIFDKNNVKSNSTSAGDDSTYKTKYTVNVTTAGGEGTTTGSVSGLIKDVDRKVTAIPASGYKFENWTQNGAVVSSNPIYFFNLGTSSASLTANFSQIPNEAFTTTFVVDGVPTVVNTDAGATIVMPADPTKQGYIFKGWYSVETDGFKVEDFTATQTVYAQWRLDIPQFDVTITQAANGTITSDAVDNKVEQDTNVVFTFTPAQGYSVKTATVNGSVVTLTDNKFTLENVTANVTATAEFEKISNAVILVENKEVAAGDTVTVNVKLMNIENLNRVAGTINYDKECLTIKKINGVDVVNFDDIFSFNAFNTTVEGQIVFDAIVKTDILNSGLTAIDQTLLTIEFIAKEDVDKETEISITNVDAQDNASPAASINVTPLIGKITISQIVTPGDVDSDGKINGVDALIVLRHIVNIEELTGSKLKAADYNGDGTVDVADARAILKKSVGL